MDLIFDRTVVLGVCLSLSESGLRGTFADPVPVGTTGLLTLYPRNAGDRNYQTHACIYSLRNEEARVRFCFQSEQERLAIRDILKLLTPR